MIFPAFLLALVGSLHCAGMCGPLVLAVPPAGDSRSGLLLSRLVYHLGRIATYCAIGALFGLAGETLALAGFQRWLSISTGALLLAGLALGQISLGRPVTRLVGGIKTLFGRLLHRRSWPAQFALGATNGLLPCGLVYVAAAAAAATGGVGTATLFMAFFGLGTLPIFLLLPLIGRPFALRFNTRRLIPFSVALVAVLLILRGLSLGIPYLSPNLAGTPAEALCH